MLEPKLQHELAISQRVTSRREKVWLPSNVFRPRVSGRLNQAFGNGIGEVSAGPETSIESGHHIGLRGKSSSVHKRLHHSE